MPEPVLDQGERLPASYANFYIGNRTVLMPAFGQSRDADAQAILQQCFRAAACCHGFHRPHPRTRLVPLPHSAGTVGLTIIPFHFGIVLPCPAVACFVSIHPMSTVDQFASVFNAASQTAFQHQPRTLENALVVTDLEPDAAENIRERPNIFRDRHRQMGNRARRRICHGQGTAQPRGIPQAELDRDLPAPAQRAWRWPYSLGEHLDVLIQESTPPVAILPHPDREGVPERALKNTDSVMAINSHLVGEDAL